MDWAPDCKAEQIHDLWQRHAYTALTIIMIKPNSVCAYFIHMLCIYAITCTFAAVHGLSVDNEDSFFFPSYPMLIF